MVDGATGTSARTALLAPWPFHSTSGFPATPAAGNIDLQGMLEVAIIGYLGEPLRVGGVGQLMPGWGSTSSAS